MLQIVIPEREYFDERKGEHGEFVSCKRTVLQLEHSLLSVSKWESKWKKTFLSNKDPLTQEELMDYIKCMTVDKNVPDEAYDYISMEDLKKIQEYIGDPHTATTIRDRRSGPQRNEIVTNELIYCWMIECGIPFECQKWHLNRLLTLIRVCNIKQSPEKKMSRQSIYAQNRELNALRRAKLGSKG